jgi:dethiobiotin synthetase
MKPVAAGCSETSPGVWSNEDVEMLLAAARLPDGVDMDVATLRQRINPYLFREALAPHLAAAHAGVRIDVANIVDCYARLRDETGVDAIVVEGSGGLLVPLNESCDGANLAQALGLPEVLVVGMRLGCINHALLTQEAMAARGLKFAGWIANRIDPAMNCFDENLETLRLRISAPLLGVVPYMVSPDPLLAAESLLLAQ